MIKDEDIKEPTYGNLEWNVKMGEGGEWQSTELEIHPPKWLWKLGLWGVFCVGLALGVVLAR